jgi:ABC-type Fe3+-hydroxamate transport system substrate-binding protein
VVSDVDPVAVAPPADRSRARCSGLWLVGLLAVVVLFTAACEPNESTTSSGGSTTSCTGSQTVTAHGGDTLTALVENHVSGSYATQQVVTVVVDMNGIADRNVIVANQQYRLPTSCGGP